MRRNNMEMEMIRYGTVDNAPALDAGRFQPLGKWGPCISISADRIAVLLFGIACGVNITYGRRSD